MTSNKRTSAEPYPLTWKDVERAQLKQWLRTSPAQRLAWLEEVLNLLRESRGSSKRD